MDNIADAVEEVAEPGCRRQKSVEDEFDETDQPAEIHVVKEDIIDEKTGKKVNYWFSFRIYSNTLGRRPNDKNNQINRSITR